MQYEMKKSTAKTKTRRAAGGKTKYPWNELEVGASFFVPFDEVKEPNIRQLASNRNGKGSVKFVVIKHNETEQYEVARVE